MGDPFRPDFLFSRITNVNFGSGPFLVVFVTRTSTVFGGGGGFPVPAITVSGAPFTLIEPVIPASTGVGGPGSLGLIFDPWRRVGASGQYATYQTGRTISDTVAKNAGLGAWLGQYLSLVYNDSAIGGISGYDLCGYVVIDLFQFKSSIINLTLDTPSFFLDTFTIGVGAWKDITRTQASLGQFSNSFSSDYLSLTLAKGSDTLYGNPASQFPPPKQAMSFQQLRLSAGAMAHADIQCVVKTGAVTLTPRV